MNILLKNRTLLSLALIVLGIVQSVSASAGTFVVNNSGTTFSPSAITIYQGDTINFVLGANHDAVEVSKATYDANGNKSNGGFKLPFGGGKNIFSKSGTYYYVCTPHAALGMKGIVKVLEHPCTSQIYDTIKVVIRDTSHIKLYDTIRTHIIDTIVLTIDTLHVPLFDTIAIFVDTLRVHIKDTIFIPDTLIIPDTVRINIFDTTRIAITDTLHLIVTGGVEYVPHYQKYVSVLTNQPNKSFTIKRNVDFELLKGTIIDITGRSIRSFSDADFNKPMLDIGKPGIYFLLLQIKQTDKNLSFACKLIVQ